ncbi:alpha-glucan family phosphorylase [Paenibacillus athensensis]|uniref:Alpha-glucan phosphorylase n=1 Tax=Paenibacillus athensensis TaxID=1967502 RepID=A0A4Y8Q637_9BACL|nr:alpha-glucan family phosphorylase [Paenibacillus athensensis]MCD1259860.1 alpha-glucan family phosphorylase [Paenibacillus athensensis]
MQAAMTTQTRVLPAAIARLNELAYNLWFSWNDDALQLFQQMDARQWEQTGHNPVRLLQELDDARLQELSADSGFLEAYQGVIARFDDYMQSGHTWFEQRFGSGTPVHIAYFSAEFGFHESLPIYSGGLGVLAGDHCKSASDLGLPFVGVGLLYKKGYFTQKIDASGGQHAEQLHYDFARLPIRPAQKDGNDLTVTIDMPGRTVTLKLWTVQVGRNPVILLDADIAANQPDDRELTGQLYGGNQDTRISQEIVLGIGGVKALRALGIYPNVYHINEGHAAFLALERLRELLGLGLPFHAAVETVRSATVFTTHTPVPAGHDAFPYGMVEHHLGPLLGQLSAHRQALLDLGRDEATGLFNMTHLALHTSGLRNGVSQLHGKVSRGMFRSFHGNVETREVPIGAITNGVHLDSWTAPEWKALLDRFLPGSWKDDQANPQVWQSVELIPDESIWSVHTKLKEKMIAAARRNLQEQRRRNGDSAERIEEVRGYLSPKALTIGFARRFATYKRANLIFSDLRRLRKLLDDPQRPVQFIFAGKAHPADHPGQELIREIHRISQLKEFAGKVVLLENYDIDLARYLVHGVDVWLNNPRRPLEASGTSGQKAAMNGVLNFSVLDGWWEEGYDGTNGWAIGSTEDADWAAQERENTESIYRLLEEEIIPLYYNQGELPHQWINRMKRSIRTLSPAYNTHRMVQDYTVQTYLPTADRATRFAMNGYETAIKVADYKKFIRDNWHQVAIVSVDDGTAASVTAAAAAAASSGTTSSEAPPQPALKRVTADIAFGPIWPPDTLVEIVHYEEHSGAWEQVIVPMQASGDLVDQLQTFTAELPAHLAHGAHFSVRVRPVSPDFAHSFELPLITTTLHKEL